MVPGNLNFIMQKNETRSLSFTLSPPLPKKEVKFKQVNIIPGVSKLLEKKKMRCTFQVISTGKDFLSRIPEAQEIRSTFDKWDHIKLKSIYIANCQSSEEAAQKKTGETFCQLYTWQRSSVQNIQRTKRLSIKTTSNKRGGAVKLNRKFSKEEI